MERPCVQCGEVFTAKRSHAKYCSQVCRNLAKRKQPTETVIAAGVVDKDDLPDRYVGEVERETRSELEEASRLETPLGAAAVRLAQRIDGSLLDTGSSVAALVRELRATLAEALKGARSRPDALDELAQRRRRRAAG